MVSVLVPLIATLRQGIAALDRQIEQAAAAHPDFAIVDSYPGAGPVLASRLLPLARSGIGIKLRPRYSSSGGLRPSWCAAERPSGFTTSGLVRSSFVKRSTNGLGIPSPWARAYYEQQRNRGAGHHAAVRALAFKWIRIAFRCWKDRVPYDNSRYLQSLRQRGSPLAAR